MTYMESTVITKALNAMSTKQLIELLNKVADNQDAPLNERLRALQLAENLISCPKNE
jgi:hypothetical protein